MSETSERAALLDDVAGDVTVVVDDGDRARASVRARTCALASEHAHTQRTHRHMTDT